MRPRTGPEPKLPWREVPASVRGATAAALGSPVTRAVRAYGGYAPSATFRLRLGDGRRAFLKGVNAGSNDHMRSALIDEERAYRDLGDLIGPWSPRFLGAFRADDWHVLLLEDLGPPTAPPWREADLRSAAQGLADFHSYSLGRELPPWLTRDKHADFAVIWKSIADDGSLERLPSQAGLDAREVEEWLAEAVPILRMAAERLLEAPPPNALLHVDVRSDNLRIVDGRLRLFDWNWAAIGPAEFDLVAFAQSVTVEGGGDPERVIAHYAERLPVRDDLVTASAAALAAYMLRGFWLPEVPGLPRLRAFQRQQAVVTLEWASRLLELEQPLWIRRLAESLPGQ